MTMLNDILQKTPEFYKGYIKLVEAETVVDGLFSQKKELLDFLSRLKEDQFVLRYSPEKWSIAEVIQHCIDTERIMCYRALCLARDEKQPLPGYDEDAYTEVCGADQRHPSILKKEWELLRETTLLLFESFDDVTLQKNGIIDGKNMGVDILGAIISGHATHHINVVKKRYLQ